MQRIIDDMTYGKARANELGLTYSPHAMIYMGNESDQTAGTTEEVYLDSFDKMIAAVNGFASDVTGKTESLRGSSISSTAGKTARQIPVIQPSPLHC
jgi:hypothetical protein